MYVKVVKINKQNYRSIFVELPKYSVLFHFSHRCQPFCGTYTVSYTFLHVRTTFKTFHIRKHVMLHLPAILTAASSLMSNTLPFLRHILLVSIVFIYEVQNHNTWSLAFWFDHNWVCWSSLALKIDSSQKIPQSSWQHLLGDTLDHWGDSLQLLQMGIIVTNKPKSKEQHKLPNKLFPVFSDILPLLAIDRHSFLLVKNTKNPKTHEATFWRYLKIFNGDSLAPTPHLAVGKTMRQSY